MNKLSFVFLCLDTCPGSISGFSFCVFQFVFFCCFLFLFFRSSASSQRSRLHQSYVFIFFSCVCVCMCLCVCICHKYAEILRGCVSCIMRFACCALALVAVCLITLWNSKEITYRAYLFLFYFLFYGAVRIIVVSLE